MGFVSRFAQRLICFIDFVGVYTDAENGIRDEHEFKKGQVFGKGTTYYPS